MQAITRELRRHFRQRFNNNKVTSILCGTTWLAGKKLDLSSDLAWISSLNTSLENIEKLQFLKKVLPYPSLQNNLASIFVRKWKRFYNSRNFPQFMNFSKVDLSWFAPKITGLSCALCMSYFGSKCLRSEDAHNMVRRLKYLFEKSPSEALVNTLRSTCKNSDITIG